MLFWDEIGASFPIVWRIHMYIIIFTGKRQPTGGRFTSSDSLNLDGWKNPTKLLSRLAQASSKPDTIRLRVYLDERYEVCLLDARKSWMLSAALGGEVLWLNIFYNLSICSYFCFSFSPIFHLIGCSQSAIFVFFPYPLPFSVIAISWNRSPHPEKASRDSGNCQEGLSWQGLDQNAALRDYEKVNLDRQRRRGPSASINHKITRQNKFGFLFLRLILISKEKKKMVTFLQINKVFLIFYIKTLISVQC